MIFKETKQTNALVYVLGRELNLAITRLLFCRKFRYIWNVHFLTDGEERCLADSCIKLFNSNFQLLKYSLFPCMSFAVMKRAPFLALSGSLINSSSEVAWGWNFYGIRALSPGNFWHDQKIPRKIFRENFWKPRNVGTGIGNWVNDREFLTRQKISKRFRTFFIQTCMIDSCRIMAFSFALLFLLANLAFWSFLSE